MDMFSRAEMLTTLSPEDPLGLRPTFAGGRYRMTLSIIAGPGVQACVLSCKKLSGNDIQALLAACISCAYPARS